MSSGSGRCLESSGRECKNIVESAAKERLKMGMQNYGEQKHTQTSAGDDLQVGQAATSRLPGSELASLTGVLHTKHRSLTVAGGVRAKY
jgi:hypothetical protein